MIYSCYGSGCPNERWDGECKFHGNVRKCPIDMSQEELEREEAERELDEEINREN